MPAPDCRINPFRMNKYQRRMLAIPIISLFVLTGLMTAVTVFGWVHFAKVFGAYAKEIEIINSSGLVFLFVIWVYTILVIIAIISISSHLLGAFERLSGEMDGIFRLKKKRKILVRRNDYPASELIIRINKLIQETNFEE